MILLLTLAACDTEPDPHERLLRHYAAAPRPVALRLAGVPYTRTDMSRANSETQNHHLSAAAHSVLANVVSSTARTRALAHLVTGDAAGAVAVLDPSTSRAQAGAEFWNDRAVALYELATRTGDARSFLVALVSAERALRLRPKFSEAQFNRAAILDATGLQFAAAEEWKKYLKLDDRSPWAEEARRNLRMSLQPTASARWAKARETLEKAVVANDCAAIEQIVRPFPQDTRTYGEGEYLRLWAEAHIEERRDDAVRWLRAATCIGRYLRSYSGEALLADAVAAIGGAHGGALTTLARAHLDYARARQLISERLPARAESLLEAAERGFRLGRSPMALVARYYRAGVAFDQRRTAESLALLRSIEQERRPEYIALHAQVTWERSRINGRLGDEYKSIALAHDAAAAFSSLGELKNAARNRIEIASKLCALGRPEEGWRVRLAAFRESAATGQPSVIAAALHSAARDEVSDGSFETARALFDVLLTVKDISPVIRADALAWKTFAAVRAHDAVTEATVADLQKSAAAIQDEALRGEAEDQARLVQALLTADSRLALELATRCIEFRERAGRVAAMAEARLVRARTYRRLNERAAAVADLEAALRAKELQRTAIASTDLRDTFFDSGGEACRDLIALRVESGEAAAAFETAERCRTRSSPAHASGVRPVENALSRVQRNIAPDAIVADYVFLERYALLTAITRSGLRLHIVNVPERELIAAAAKLRAELAADRINEARAPARQLYRALIEPMRDLLTEKRQLVVVGDADVAAIPFAALEEPSSGLPLVSAFEIVLTPSAAAFADEPRALPSGGKVVVVGNPATSMPLANLPAAAAEAANVGRTYKEAVVLTGHAASTERFMAEAGRANVIHVAAHALVGSRDPLQTGIALADVTPHGGFMSARQIASMTLQRPIVVLAGCQTGIPGAGRGTVRSIASAFLAAGAREVVASLWDLPDGATHDFSVRLHRRLSAGLPAATALRETQLETLRSRDGRGARSGLWSAFTVYTSN